MAPWKEIKSLEQWQSVLEESTSKTVLLLKHSTTCPISANGWSECQAYTDGNPRQDVDYILVKVIESRPVSNKIAEDLGVKHESPQAILIKDKKSVWNASHWSITQQILLETLKQSTI